MPNPHADLYAYRALRHVLYNQLDFWKAYDKLGTGTIFSRRRCLERFIHFRRKLAPHLITPVRDQLRRSLADNSNAAV